MKKMSKDFQRMTFETEKQLYYNEDWSSVRKIPFLSLEESLRAELEKNRVLTNLFEESETEKVRLGHHLTEKTSEHFRAAQQKQLEHESACQRLRRSFEEKMNSQRTEHESRIRKMSETVSGFAGTVSGLQNDLRGHRREIEELKSSVGQKSEELKTIRQLYK